ncbi:MULTISPECIES: (2Fe-2S)-binding protein [unclassified Achromobacter]|uniref:(2Fe-2S)-binding protein n=1 Tax=unclassified Achromobacter TaxID=2626865 RepID=UPI000B5150C6|nr:MULTISPECIES: (2Fe-2S)-binding protein [unclassified Achromobacter]OWT73484.1 sulfurtransferase [Achromobacter sp. HZ34]OWT79597.1 sulfurtransferase [Achromobacter sp. HZ28]
MTVLSRPLLTRTAASTAFSGDTLTFHLNGEPCTARRGDTVLTAILLQGDRLRLSPFSEAPRAGFCLMGACQDCWVLCPDGKRVRACSTLVDAGMELLCPVQTAPDAASVAVSVRAPDPDPGSRP